MKKIVLLLIVATSLYASGYYKRMLENCDQMYSAYKNDYKLVTYFAERSSLISFDPCTKLGKVNRSSSLIEEAQDEIDFLEFQQKTVGIACEQVKKGINISFKSDYCSHLSSTNSQSMDKPINSEIKQYEVSVQKKQIDPAVQYKKAPQLKLSNMHIYGIKNITYFRDKKDIVMIESSTGNFALPLNVIVSAERINFTSELSQKIDALNTSN